MGKIFIGVFALILLWIGGSYIFIQLLPDMCNNVVLAQYLSPNNKLKAVTFQRDCGATTSFSTQVSILSSTDTLGNESGNIFIADTNHDAAPIGQGGGPEVQINWLSDSHLQIQKHNLARIFRAETKYEGIKIEYIHF